MSEGQYDLKVFDPSKPKRRRQMAPPPVTIASLEEKPAVEIATPSTATLKPNAWLDDDKETGKERDYQCVPVHH